jgi:hypothetical protein
VVDTNENGLTELTRTLRSQVGQYVPKIFLTYPMNFGDAVFEKMFLSNAPFDIVANFAAHKHVRSEKDQFSIEAMISNNVFKANDFFKTIGMEVMQCQSENEARQQIGSCLQKNVYPVYFFKSDTSGEKL